MTQTQTATRPLPATTYASCPCADKQYSDMPGYRCDHMKALAAGQTAEAQPETQADEPLVIDIQKGKDGRWYVTAHASIGDIHDAFDTQAEAIDFAVTFYGGEVQTVGQPTVSKPRPACAKVQVIPATNAAAVTHYHTTHERCDCPDRQNRGGSYITRDGKVCKHIHAVRSGIIAPYQAPPARKFSDAEVDDMFACFELV